MIATEHHPLYDKVRTCNQRIDEWKRNDDYFYFSYFDGIDGPKLTVDNRKIVTFSSYSYLDLISNKRIAAAAQAAIDTYGTGTIGSFVLGGGYDVHRDLVEKIASFTGREDAILFTSGFVTNMGTITALVGKGDHVISDNLNHASLIEGCHRSGGVFRVFRHNDMAQLEKLLKRSHKAKGGSLVVCDAVFSMDGDILNLPKVVELCRQYNALLMVDEAHSIGVLGETGHGIEEHFATGPVIDIKMGTLSKTIPAGGGYIAGKKDLINFLRWGAKGHLFSGAMAPGTAAAALEGFRIIEEEGVARKQKLFAALHYFKSKMSEAGFILGSSEKAVAGHDDVDTPIIPIMICDEKKALHMTRICLEDGLYIPAIVYPGVAKGKERLRATLTAGHGKEEIDTGVEILVNAAKKAGLALPMNDAVNQTSKQRLVA